MSKKIHLAGSLAYDHILYYPGNFADLISSGEEGMNLSINVSDKTVQFGGTAGNIAYNLTLLGDQPVLMGVAGKDFHEYKEWLNKNSIDTDKVKVFENEFTATAYITSDNVGNQIISFYKGASVNDVDFGMKNYQENISYFSISPDKKERMLALLHEARFLGIPFMFDPGQVITEFTDLECLSFIEGPTVLIFNQFELKTFMKKTNLTREQILEKVPLLIETLRETGSLIMTKNDKHYIKPVMVSKAQEPTGCGDAYRAGILHGLTKGLDIKVTGQIASLIATYNLESKGTQNHKFTKEEFKKRYADVFGDDIPVEAGL